MEKPDDLKFEAGQLAESKTFEDGFRGAWFRCKIKDINLNQILAEYFDFVDKVVIEWTKIYELPHYGRKSKQIKKQLMVRPPYPKMYLKNETPPVNSIIEVCVVIDGEWKVGDLIDWSTDDCYWSARIIKILSDDEVQIELPMPPAGQGGIYDAFCKDLRPSLNWTPLEGWTFPTMRGQASCSAQLIFPSQQGMDSESREDEVASPQNASSTSRISVISLAAPIEEEEALQSQEVKTDGDDVEKVSSSDSISTMRVEENKTDSISTMRVEENKTDDDAWDDVDHNMIDLNIMHEETLEASILDLEELANRIKWLKSILDTSRSNSGSWKFEGES